MTIAISIKVNDGIVLAADSASTLMGDQGVINVYENGNKVTNLHKELPIGIITWGVGGIGSASVSTLIKDFRKRIMGMNRQYEDWAINPDHYTIESVAKRFKEFIFDEVYDPLIEDKSNYYIGFLVAGYSSNGDLADDMAEEWLIQINEDTCEGPLLIRDKEECGLSWHGEPEAISRLVFGFSDGFIKLLLDQGVDEDVLNEAIENSSAVEAKMVFSPMPIQDVIDLAGFLVDLSKNYSRFIPGAVTISGPTEIAAITKHEGYKWIVRKHYYSQEYNISGGKQ